MARVTKRPEVRREELLDIALRLCGEVGYQAMSVESVTAAAGVAKGTFYHYFDSKQDMLFQMLRRVGDDLMTHLGEQAAQGEGDAIARLAVLMRAANGYKMVRFNEYAPSTLLYRPENFELRHRLFQTWSDAIRNVLRPVVTQGVAEGTFVAEDLESTLDVVSALWFEVVDRLFLRAIAEPDAGGFARVLIEGTDGIWRAQERLLGVPPGSFALELPANFAELMEPVYAELSEGVK